MGGDSRLLFSFIESWDIGGTFEEKRFYGAEIDTIARYFGKRLWGLVFFASWFRFILFICFRHHILFYRWKRSVIIVAAARQRQHNTVGSLKQKKRS